MELRQLQNHLRTLIELEESGSPVVSYFLDRENPDGPEILREQSIAARKALDRVQRPDFDRALDRIEDHVPWKLSDPTRSVAVYARSGSSPLFQVLEFEAAIPTRLFVESTPAVFPLVELKDDYDRYVLMICNEASARILEVSLGSVTREVWTRRPELRKRVGRAWTRLHYQNHRRDGSQRFVEEKVALVERIFASGGHAHLMLAGSSKVLAHVRKALPRRLQAKLIDTIPAASRHRATDVVAATLSAFAEHEERESPSIVGQLRKELRRGGLAVCGFGDCHDALQRGQADLLVILSDDGRPGRARREELVRLAVQQELQVETVQDSDALAELAGVGCLLRYPNWSPALPLSDRAAERDDTSVSGAPASAMGG